MIRVTVPSSVQSTGKPRASGDDPYLEAKARIVLA